MELRFGQRKGNEREFVRAMLITLDDASRVRCVLSMQTNEHGQRRGFVHRGHVLYDDLEDEEESEPEEPPSDWREAKPYRAVLDGPPIWEGEVLTNATPLRATCVAAGLVDDSGTYCSPPAWLVG